MRSESEIVFACYSKACAPPPVGKGGSSGSKGNIFAESGDGKMLGGRRTRYKSIAAARARAQASSLYQVPTRDQLTGRPGRLFGKGFDALFTGDSLTIVNPFPMARRSKANPKFYDSEHVARELRKPVVLKNVDPRTLVSTQGGLTRPGVNYYMSPEYKRTGRTHADQESRLNQYPTVYHKKSTGELIIISGNHRAAADLLSGQPLKARVIESP